MIERSVPGLRSRLERPDGHPARAAFPRPYLGRDGYAADFRNRVGWNGQAMSAPIVQNGADRFLGVEERLPLGVALRHHFRQSRNKHGVAAVRLRLKDDRKTVAHGRLLWIRLARGMADKSRLLSAGWAPLLAKAGGRGKRHDDRAWTQNVTWRFAKAPAPAKAGQL